MALIITGSKPPAIPVAVNEPETVIATLPNEPLADFFVDVGTPYLVFDIDTVASAGEERRLAAESLIAVERLAAEAMEEAPFVQAIDEAPGAEAVTTFVDSSCVAPGFPFARSV